MKVTVVGQLFTVCTVPEALWVSVQTGKLPSLRAHVQVTVVAVPGDAGAEVIVGAKGPVALKLMLSVAVPLAVPSAL